MLCFMSITFVHNADSLNSEFELKVLSWNIQSFNFSNKTIISNFNSEKFLLIKQLNLHNHDIFAFQEIQSNKKTLKKLASFSLPDRDVIFSTSDINPNASLAVYYQKNISLLDYEEILPGRILKILFMRNNIKFYIYNVYNFTANQIENSLNLLNMLNDDLLTINNEYPTFILGDMNIDILNQTSRLSRRLIDLINLHSLTNVADKFNNWTPSWRGGGHRAQSSSRIDYILSKNYSLDNKRFENLNVPLSDHSILSLEKEIFIKSEFSLHPYAILKEHLLDNPKFKENFLTKLIEILKKNFLFNALPNCHMQEKFLGIKHIDIESFIFLDNPEFFEPDRLIHMFHLIFLELANQSNLLYKKIKSSKNKLFKRFRKTCEQLEFYPSDSNINNFINAKSELKNQLTENFKIKNEYKRVQKLQTSSKLSNSIFYHLGKNGGRNINRIRNPTTGVTTTNPEEIVTIFSDNYKSKTCDSHNQNKDPSTVFPKILQVLLNEFNVTLDDVFPNSNFVSEDNEFYCDEIKSILSKMKNKVTPGRSKLSKHSLLFIFKYIPNLFTAYINALINKEDLSSDPNTAWILAREIIFIKKKAKDALDVNSFRPISLLETIYKLISKLTISRLEKNIFSCLSKSQFGFVKGKQMSLATHTINQLISAINKKGLSAALISIDIRAAFDSAKHSTLNATLLHLFPNNSIIKKIAKFSHNPVAQVNIGGVLGSEIKLSKGVGQGDPSSSTKYLVLHHLFNFFIEKFLEQEQLAISKCVLHDSLPDIPQENISFADDTIILINQSLNLEKSHKFLGLYSKLKDLTGLEINPSKSSYFMIGENPSDEFILALPILASEKQFLEHLGVILAPDIEKAKKQTYEKIEIDMKKQSKFLTTSLGSVDTFTKINLIRTLIMSKPQHCFRVYSPNSDTLDNIWKIFKTSLWSKSYQDKIFKRTKVAANRLNIPVEDGGLGIIHVKTTAALSMLSSFTSILLHANCDENSILTATLHKDSDKSSTAIRFLNSHYFQVYWAKKMKKFFFDKQLIEHSQELFEHLELDENYGLFMPVLNHKLLSPKIKLLGVFKPNHFEDGDLSDFPNIISLLDIYKIKGKSYIRKDSYNFKIDSLCNEIHKKHLKILAITISNKIDFKLNKFALKNKKLTFFEIVAKYSPKTMLGALKRIAHKISGHNNPPPPSWTSHKKDGSVVPPLDIFRNSFKITTHSKLPPSLRSFHYDYLSRIAPSLTKLSQFKNNDIHSSICPRSECNDMIATSEHIVYDCIFAQSILRFINEAYSRRDILLFKKTDDIFYLFPHKKTEDKQFLERVVLATQIKITAFKIVTQERFSTWTNQHFYVKLLNIIKSSIQICELYGIPITYLHMLLDYAEFAALGFLHHFMFYYEN